MLKNPNIILLDEPTSALDSFNEEEISQALTNLFK
jgi:ABC-type multidrug transport system fused ATPase/permease subunit